MGVKVFDRKRAGKFAMQMPAHAIGDNKQTDPAFFIAVSLLQNHGRCRVFHMVPGYPDRLSQGSLQVDRLVRIETFRFLLRCVFLIVTLEQFQYFTAIC